MTEQILLRVPVEVARDQLQKRIDFRISTHDDEKKQRQDWSLINIRVLEALFSSDQVVDDYRELVQKSLDKYGGRFISATTADALKFLRELLERLPLFSEMQTPETPSMTAKVGEAGTSATMPSNMPQAVYWEFHSEIVDDPTLGAHIEKPVYDKTLKALAADGWELVSAVPVIFTEERDRLFLQTRVEAYRLFFKRPARR